MDSVSFTTTMWAGVVQACCIFPAWRYHIGVSYDSEPNTISCTGSHSFVYEITLEIVVLFWMLKKSNCDGMSGTGTWSYWRTWMWNEDLLPMKTRTNGTYRKAWSFNKRRGGKQKTKTPEPFKFRHNIKSSQYNLQKKRYQIRSWK
jgi:hypothetical protein